ncbi:hypothetical protein D3C74_83470 [compost metagenome]
METINVSIELKNLSEMTEEEFDLAIHDLDYTKVSLMKFVWLHLEDSPKRKEIFDLYNNWLKSQDDVETFMQNFFNNNADFNPESIEQNIHDYIAWIYSIQEYD